MPRRAGSEFIKQILVLAGVAALIVFGGRAVFQYAQVYPPIVACLVSFGYAGILGLLRRILVASARLDADLGQLALSGDLLAPGRPRHPRHRITGPKADRLRCRAAGFPKEWSGRRAP